jgi:hypothetical protein
MPDKLRPVEQLAKLWAGKNPRNASMARRKNSVLLKLRTDKS